MGSIQNEKENVEGEWEKNKRKSGGDEEDKQK